MSRFLRLTRQAQDSLVDIASWTARTFGQRQARAYEEELIARCRMIADGTVPSRSCRDLLDPGVDENLRFVRCGQHFAIFVEDDTTVSVLDFLHARSDLPAKLARLSGS